MELEYESDITVAEFRQLLVIEPGELLSLVAYAATVRTVESACYLEQCSLTRSARTDYSHHLALSDREVYTGQHGQFAIRFPDIVYLNHIKE